MAHVPLAHEGGLVADFLQVLREENDVLADGGLVVHDTVPVRELAGQDRGSAW